jgi:tRNA A-37 threonylcarbamoyl transferase component Bud32
MLLSDLQEDSQSLALSRTFKYIGPPLGALEPGRQSVVDELWQPWPESDPATLADPMLSSGRRVVDHKYLLLSVLGTGGMGAVYRVKHLLLGKEMALKTFRTASLSAITWQRFQREAQAIARLSHKNIVQVFDYGICEDNLPYYTMELLRGQSLADKLKKYGRLNLETALPIFKAVASALAHAHKLDIVHRDIKPGNIFLDQSNVGETVVKVVDFGLAKLAAPQDHDRQAVTEGNFIFGSPLYMSPEQATASATDRRTDIYSFGCAFFESLTGRPPFRGHSAFETLHMHLNEVPPGLVDANAAMGFNKALEDLMARLLAKDVHDRFQSFDEVLLELSVLESDFCGTTATTTTTTAQMPVYAPGAGAEQTETFVERRSKLSKRSVLFCLMALMVATTSFAFAQKNVLFSAVSAGAKAYLPARKADGCLGKYYSTVGSNGDRKFTFPADEDLGYISWDGLPARHARGVVIVPAHTMSRFEPSEELTKRPELLAHFRADDFCTLACLDPCSWNLKFLDAVTSRLSGLTVIELNNSFLKDDCIVYLNKLEHLVGLSVGESSITGHGLTKLKRLRQLIHLEASEINGISETLLAMKGSEAVVSLQVDDCDLTDSDMQTISGFRRITDLSINNNPVTTEGLKHLLTLAELKYLSIANTSLRPDAIGVLPKFKQINMLHLNEAEWSASDLERLRSLMPPGAAICSHDHAFTLSKLFKT